MHLEPEVELICNTTWLTKSFDIKYLKNDEIGGLIGNSPFAFDRHADAYIEHAYIPYNVFVVQSCVTFMVM